MAKRPAPDPRGPREPWQIEQGDRCGCRGYDDMCACQNAKAFIGLEITLRVGLDGFTTTRTTSYGDVRPRTQQLLDKALEALLAEIDDFKKCPIHNPLQNRPPEA